MWLLKEYEKQPTGFLKFECYHGLAFFYSSRKTKVLNGLRNFNELSQPDIKQ
jgi:hypothetical protein